MLNQHLSVIGVPMDLGQTRRGVDMGPSAIRYAGLRERLIELSYEVKDLGDLQVSYPNNGNENQKSKDELPNLTEVAEVNTKLAKLVYQEVKSGRFPLVLGGDHSIAIGSLAGLSNHYENLGVIWYDAHTDINTFETSPSKNIHGMPLAISLGMGHEKLTQISHEKRKIKPENVVIIVARSIDSGEKEIIRHQGLTIYTMHEIDRLGMSVVMERAIAYLKEKTDGVHFSLDLDALDPSHAPGVGTPVNGGLTYRESHLAMEMLSEADIITSAEVVEVNPILDDGNKTAETAVSLIGSLFGEKII